MRLLKITKEFWNCQTNSILYKHLKIKLLLFLTIISIFIFKYLLKNHKGWFMKFKQIPIVCTLFILVVICSFFRVDNFFWTFWIFIGSPFSQLKISNTISILLYSFKLCFIGSPNYSSNLAFSRILTKANTSSVSVL